MPEGEAPGALAWLTALGGAGNLRELGACTTRLRLVLEAPDAIDEPALRVLGARGIVSLGGGAMQVIVGPRAEALCEDIASAADRPAVAADLPRSFPMTESALSDAAVRALGGSANIVASIGAPGRIAVTLADATRWDAVSLEEAMMLRHAELLDGTVHILTRRCPNWQDQFRFVSGESNPARFPARPSCGVGAP